MNSKKVFRVAVLGSQSAEQWLMVKAFAASGKGEWSYELVKERPDIFVVDSEHDHAPARWAAQDSTGAVPAAFVGLIHARAKRAVSVPRPFTSGRVVEALDQLVRRFMEVQAPAAAQREATLPPQRELVPA